MRKLFGIGTPRALQGRVLALQSVFGLLTDPEGEDLPSEAFVFGDEIGGHIGSVKTAWRMALSEPESWICTFMICGASLHAG
jgi:hypothetical protein